MKINLFDLVCFTFVPCWLKSPVISGQCNYLAGSSDDHIVGI